METLKFMCEQKTYPPGFTVQISQSVYQYKDIELRIAFPGAKDGQKKFEDDKEDIEFFVSLKAADMCSAKERGEC